MLEQRILSSRTMTIAITTWDERVSPVLDVARRVELYGYANDQLQLLKVVELPGDNFEAQVAALCRLDTRLLICGALSRPLAQSLRAAGFELVPFTSGSVEAVVAAWQAQRLPQVALRMPGCRGRNFAWCGSGDGGARRGRGRGRGGQGLGRGGGCRPPLDPNIMN